MTLFPLSFIELVAVIFAQETFVMHPLAVEMFVGKKVPKLKVPADNVVHETVIILAFAPEILTNEQVTIDTLLQLKLRKLAVSPHTLFNDTLLNLHICTLAFVEKIVVHEHVVIQELTNDAALPFIIEQNDVLRFQKDNDTELKQLDNKFVITLDKLPIEA